MTSPDKHTRVAAPLDGRELALVSGVLLFGAVLRVWGFSHLGVCHFDEGVYAISGSWTQPPGKEFPLYPRQILFAPPLYFLLIGIVAGTFRLAADQAAFAVSVAMGVATTALAWWATRRWFGSSAAMIAAVLLASSEYQIAFSRVALTDMTFGFFFLLALVLIAEACERASLAWAVPAGLAVGLAWNTKYHGWLPVAIAFAVLVFVAVWGRNGGRDVKRAFLCCGVVAAIAAACYLPWLLYIQFWKGGYFAFAEYQRTFVSLHWWADATAQIAMQGYFDGWLSRISPLAAVLLSMAFRPRWAGNALLLALTCLALLGAGIALGGIGTEAVAAFLAVPTLLRQKRYPALLLLSWLGALFVLTPFYRPYARLLIPLSLGLCIAAGVGLNWVLDAAAKAASAGTTRREMMISGAIAGACGLLILAFGVRPTPSTWTSSDSLHRAVEQLGAELPRDSTVFVHGAPEVAFYLRAYSRNIICIDLPIDNPENVARYHPGGENHFLVTAIYSQRELNSRTGLRRLIPSRLQPLGAYPVRPNDVRLLDDFSSARAHAYRQKPTDAYDLHLYRVLPATGAPH